MSRWQKLRDPRALKRSAAFRLNRLSDWLDARFRPAPSVRHWGQACTWESADGGTLFDIPFRVVRTGYNEAQTTDSEIILLKWKEFFDDYAALLPEPPRRILEVGFFEGGSTLMLAAMWPDAEIIAIDLRSGNAALKQHVRRLGLSHRVHLHYRVSQSDRGAIARILDEADFRPDLIIDDASHRYGLSKETFDITYPRLAPGGAYVLEDWGWAHVTAWRHFTQFADEPALSNLVREITLASATSPRKVDRLFVNRRMMAAFKGLTCPPLPADFSLNSIYTARGEKLTDLL